MKKKVLTLILCLTMALSLEACGGNDPVETSFQEHDTTEEDDEDQSTETVSDIQEAEPSADPDEKVELTPDTIDKYFGFEYVAVADDAITEFSIGEDDIHGPSIPCAYTDTTAPDLNQTWTMGDPIYATFNPWTRFLRGNKELICLTRNRITLKDNIPDYTSDEILTLIEDKNIPVLDWQTTYYALLAPGEVVDVKAHGGTLYLYNASDDFISAMDGTFVGLDGTLSPVYYTVAGDITQGSTIEEVVTKYPPSEGRFLDNSPGQIILTWNTASGTVVEIQFCASNHDYKVQSVRMRSADMPEDIFELLCLS